MTAPHIAVRATPRPFYGDHDELEIEVEIRGSVIGGVASVFADHDVLDEMRRGVSVFPARIGERRAFAFGIANRFSLELTVNDRGRVKVVAQLKIHCPEAQSDVDKLETTFYCDLSGVDAFSTSLLAFEPNIPCEAVLAGRPWHDA